MDVNAGDIIEGRRSIDEVGREIAIWCWRGRRAANRLGIAGPPRIHPDLQEL